MYTFSAFSQYREDAAYRLLYKILITVSAYTGTHVKQSIKGYIDGASLPRKNCNFWSRRESV